MLFFSTLAILNSASSLYFENGTHSNTQSIKSEYNYRPDMQPGVKKCTEPDYMELKKVLKEYISTDPGRHITHLVRMSFHDLMNYNPFENQGVIIDSNW